MATVAKVWVLGGVGILRRCQQDIGIGRSEILDLERFCRGHNTREGSIECLKDLLSEASAKFLLPTRPPLLCFFLGFLGSGVRRVWRLQLDRTKMDDRCCRAPGDPAPPVEYWPWPIRKSSSTGDRSSETSRKCCESPVRMNRSSISSYIRTRFDSRPRSMALVMH